MLERPEELDMFCWAILSDAIASGKPILEITGIFPCSVKKIKNALTEIKEKKRKENLHLKLVTPGITTYYDSEPRKSVYIFAAYCIRRQKREGKGKDTLTSG